MTRIALLTDTHFGARNDSSNFDAFFKKFYDEVFFPYLNTHEIKTVIHLGDVFDRRKYINFNTLRSCKNYFFEPLKTMGVDMYVIPGNHDTYFKNTNELNSVDLLLGQYPNIEIIQKCTTVSLENREVSFVPWICSENYVDTINFLKDKSGLCFGHFEIEGFHMFRGIKNEGGLNRDVLKNFDKVLTGHFHHRSTADNIYYLGSPYGMTWSDHADVRGFHIYDTNTDEITFIPNPNEIFHKIYYDERKPELDASLYKKACVKLIVTYKTDYQKFNNFVDALYINEVHELTIHENFSEFESDSLDDDVVNIEDTMTVLSDYVDSIESAKDKERLKTLLKTLYIEAQHLES